MVADNDWRLRGQEAFLQGAQLVHRAWRQSRPDWDHDHCEFCWAKFSDGRIGDALHEGYCTPDEYHWICGQCFDDFKERFQFSLVQEEGPPTIDELRAKYKLESEWLPDPKSKGQWLHKKSWTGDARIK